MAPGEFAIEEVDYETEYGIVIPARIFSHENESGRYSVTVVDYRDAQKLHDERLGEIGGIYQPIYAQVDVRGSIAYAAKRIRDRATTIDYDAYHYISRIEGHQLQTTNPDQTRTLPHSICMRVVSTSSTRPSRRISPRLECFNNLSSLSTRTVS